MPRISAEAALVVGTGTTLVLTFLAMTVSPTSLGVALPLVLSTTYMNHFFLWTTLTCAFTETSLLKLVLDLGLLVWVVGRFGPLEDLLSPVRLAALTVVAAVGSALGTSVWIFLGFVVTRWEALFFSPTYGYGPVLMAYLVLLAQKMPTENVLPTSLGGGSGRALRVQHLPFAWLCVSATLRLFMPPIADGRGLAMDFPLVACSFVLSWAYLRFFAHNQDGSVGDASEEFQFVGLFPRVLQPSLGPFFNFWYGVSVLCGMCKERELALASSLIAEEETLMLREGGGVFGNSSSSGGGLGKPQAAGKQSSGKKASLLVGGAAHKPDPVAERRKAKVGRTFCVAWRWFLGGMGGLYGGEGRESTAHLWWGVLALHHMTTNLGDPIASSPTTLPQAMRVLDARLKTMASGNKEDQKRNEEEEMDLEASATGAQVRAVERGVVDATYNKGLPHATCALLCLVL